MDVINGAIFEVLTAVAFGIQRPVFRRNSPDVSEEHLAYSLRSEK
jgi:hypothetical protein